MSEWRPEDICPPRKPRGMSDADHAAWFARSKARIEASINDPRPLLTDQELAEALERDLDEIYGKKADAAA